MYADRNKSVDNSFTDSFTLDIDIDNGFNDSTTRDETTETRISRIPLGVACVRDIFVGEKVWFSIVKAHPVMS